MLRAKIRRCEDDEERNVLSKKLFFLRKKLAAERERVELREDAKAGKSSHKRPSKLFPVVGLHNGETVTSDPMQMAELVQQEFGRRWRGSPDHVESEFLSRDISVTDFDISAEDDFRKVKKIPRPWIKDSRGIPPMAFLGGDNLVSAVLLPLKQLLAMDTDWADLDEKGYVKQKVASGVDPRKLRAVIPQTTALRILSYLVVQKIQPLLNQYSDEHGFDTRVLGARKGGQLLDIISCAKFSLELGRDSHDQAAVAQ